VRKFFFSVLVTAILGFASGCGSSSGSTPVGVPVGGSGGNKLSIAVDGGPISGVNYEDAAFASAKICVPGSTSSCVTVDHLLVDTGSVGLRVLASALGTVSLPVTTSSGMNLNDCAQFVDNSFVWGQVESADVTLAGEVASNIPIHVLADPTGFAIPSTCNTGGPDEDQLGSATTVGLGANGILGVGLEPVDCLACDQSISGLSTPPTGFYYLCSSSSCQSAFVPEGNQVLNPPVAFSVDNNGVIVELTSPSSSTEASLTGSLIFGIGTQSNNGLGSQTIFTLDNSDNFTTVFPTTGGQTLTSSFIDSGSNGIFFPDSAANVPVVQCTASGFTTFYCPTSTQALSAQNLGANGASSTVGFNVDNAHTLLTTDFSDAVMQNLAGSNGVGTCVGGLGQCSFDWGLPFFYGRNVYVAIDGQAVPSNASQPSPWWAY